MSYRLKLTITISLLIAISFGIGGTLMITTSFNATLKQETQSALSSFESVQNMLYLLNSLGDQSDYESLADALSQMEAQGLGRWQALTLKSSEEELFRSESAELLSYTLPVPSADQCSYLPVADDKGHGLIVMSMISAGETDLQLQARFDVSHIYEIRAAQQKQYFIVYIAVVFFGIIASVVLSFALTRHLYRFTTTVRKISGGDLSKRSRITSNDEFGQLSRDFDAMAEKLQENIV